PGLRQASQRPTTPPVRRWRVCEAPHSGTCENAWKIGPRREAQCLLQCELSWPISEVTAMISVTRCRLFERTAEELMTRDVVCIPRAMTLRGAAHRLIELDISGTPVTDDQGRCVGMLSRSDLVRFLDKGAAPHADAYEEFTADWGLACLEAL